MTLPYLTFSNSVKIPMIGYGTSRTAEKLEESLLYAIKCGYRHIDTAYFYENEQCIGNVLEKVFSEGEIKRSDIFITTKLHSQFYHRDDVKGALKNQLKALKLDYVDLYLMHVPWGVKKVEGNKFPMENGKVVAGAVDHLETWQAMEDVYIKGLTRSIGLSNFHYSQIQRIHENAIVKPHNLQLQCHAYWPQNELYDLCSKLNIVMTAYGPLGSPAWHVGNFKKPEYESSIPKQYFDSKPKLLKDETVAEIGQTHRKTSAQILLRWLIQRNMVVIPKSVTEQRIEENINIFDFELTEGEMNRLSNLPVRDRLFGTMDQVFKDHPQFLPNECF